MNYECFDFSNVRLKKDYCKKTLLFNALQPVFRQAAVMNTFETRIYFSSISRDDMDHLKETKFMFNIYRYKTIGRIDDTDSW